MQPPRTRGDWIFFLAIWTIVLVMGVLMLAFPRSPLPTDRSGFVRHIGLLETVVERHSGRRSSAVAFRLVGDSALYESRAPRIHEVALGWRDGHTRMVFFSVPDPAEGGRPPRRREVYGLSADGLAVRTLEADIQFVNAGISPVGGWMALTIGLLGYGVAAISWRKRRRT